MFCPLYPKVVWVVRRETFVSMRKFCDSRCWAMFFGIAEPALLPAKEHRAMEETMFVFRGDIYSVYV